jgi:hypothetical protein
VALSDPGDQDYAQWDRGNIRGIGRRRFVRRDIDPETGLEADIYELVDEEWDNGTFTGEGNFGRNLR